ncbi:hypothetical protein FB451DRAFT_1512627 [Mycena latifolia]|nr:hypothetical protein FB451DRAFT_1512627 [Mycena latifolia]
MDICSDPAHHIGAALTPPSPTPPALIPAHVPHSNHGSMPSVKGGKPTLLAAGVKAEDVSPWLRWAVSPRAALALLMAPPVLALPTAIVIPFLPEPIRPATNPLIFTAFFLLSYPAPFPLPPSSALRTTTAPEYTKPTQLYTKGPADLLLLGWTMIVFSFLRLVFAHTFFPALARRWGITKEGKLVRFEEQGYAVVLSVSGLAHVVPRYSQLSTQQRVSNVRRACLVVRATATGRGRLDPNTLARSCPLRATGATVTASSALQRRHSVLFSLQARRIPFSFSARGITLPPSLLLSVFHPASYYVLRLDVHIVSYGPSLARIAFPSPGETPAGDVPESNGRNSA